MNGDYAGVHPTLKRTFYPHFEYADTGKYEKSDRELKTRHLPKRGKQRGAQAKGKELGSLVDTQVAELTFWCRHHHLKPQHFLYPSVTIKYLLQDNAHLCEEFHRFRRSLNNHTKKLLTYLKSKNLIPYWAQLRVFDHNIKVRTDIDLVCIDEACVNTKVKPVTIIEVKTGYNNYYERHSGHKLLYPYHGRYDSVHNQNQLQLLFEVWLYQSCRHELGPEFHHVKEAIVLRLHGTRYTSYPLENWTLCNDLKLKQIVFTRINPQARSLTFQPVAFKRKASDSLQGTGKRHRPIVCD